jgi:YihY family inner membrane protein
MSALLDPRWLHAFARHLWQHFREDRCFEAAAGLAYTSLLALVPLMAVMLGVLSAFPMGELEDLSEHNPVDRVLLQALHEIQTQSDPVLQRSIKSFLGPAVTDGEPMTKGDH